MKHALRRDTTALLCLLALLAMAALYSGWRLYLARAALDNARQNAAQVQQLAAQIEQLRTGDPRAVLTAVTVDEMSARVEAAALEARVPLEQLVRIDPQTPRRVDQTNYQQQTTRVELQRVTLEQLVTLLDGCIEEPSNWVVPHIRLTAPRDGGTGSRETGTGAVPELWHVEVDLTQFIFAPTNPAPRQR